MLDFHEDPGGRIFPGFSRRLASCLECYFGTLGSGFADVSGAHRLMMFIQLDVGHKRFRLAGPTQSVQREGLSRACYVGTPMGGFGEVSGAHRLVLFIQLEVAHKHFHLARPTQSAQTGRLEPSMLLR